MSIGLIPPSSAAPSGVPQLLAAFTASGSATLDCATRNQGSFSGALFQGDFDIYEVVIHSVRVSTNANLLIRMSTDGGATYDSGANYSDDQFAWRNGGTGFGGGTGLTSIHLNWYPGADAIIASATQPYSATFRIYNPLSSSYYKELIGVSSNMDVGSLRLATMLRGAYEVTTPANAFRLLPDAGTLTTGNVYIFGIPKSAAIGNTNVLTGRVVQVVNTETGAVATGTTLIPIDDTIPQNTEGTEFMSLAITPTSATNKLKIEVVFFGSTSVASDIILALFQDSTVNALAAISEYNDSATGRRVIGFTHYMTAGTTSSTTFKVRGGPHTAATLTFNGSGGSRLYGGVAASSITITEIAV